MQRPDNENHALLVGSITGLLMRAQAEGEMPIRNVRPFLDEAGNYLTSLEVTMPSGKYIVTVDREPINEEATLTETLAQ